MIDIKDICKSYDDKKILKDLNFQIDKGRIHAFLGRNGAGKTTFIRGFMDIFKFDSGSITIEGRPFVARDYRIGYLPEERGMYKDVPIMDQLIYFSSLRGIDEEEAQASIMVLLERLDLAQAAGDKLGSLSKGNQQKVQLIQALMNDPQIIVLDEPFSGLDPVNSRILQELILEIMDGDKYMVFCSHQMSHVEDICQDLTMIDHGQIVLDGDIDKIKEAKGQGKLEILASQETYQAIQEGPYACQPREEGILVDLGTRSKEDFLTWLVQAGLDFSSLADYRPSLNEIYIETVGD